MGRPIEGEDAEKLKAVCPMGVFDIEDGPSGVKRAVVANPRKCTTCRECIEEKFPAQEKGLELGKRKDHYIFTIESTGAVPAPVLFEKALIKLKDKCTTAKSILQQWNA